MTTSEKFYAENIRCEGCANTIKSELLKIPGVQAVTVAIPEKKIAVMGIGINRAQITATLKKLGYPESGHNSFFSKALSFVSCSAGK